MHSVNHQALSPQLCPSASCLPRMRTELSLNSARMSPCDSCFRDTGSELHSIQPWYRLRMENSLMSAGVGGGAAQRRVSGHRASGN